MNLLELKLFIILDSIVGSVLFAGGALWMICINWTTGLNAVGIGSAIIAITMLVTLAYYMWEVYHNVLEVSIILGSIIGSMLFSGGILWMVFVSRIVGFKFVGFGAAVIVITMLTALLYYMWEVYHDGKEH